MARNLFINENNINVEVEYKNINLEKPIDKQVCIVSNGNGFYGVMTWDENKGWDCPWNKGYYKLNFWYPLPFIANLKDMMKEQAEIEVDQYLMKEKKI